jgi:ribosome-associated translation inhibitor RaiA
MHIIAKDQNIYTSVEKDDLYTAIDILKDEVIRKLKSEKSKQRSFLRKGGAKLKDILKGFTNKR